jgi:Gas vesicle protein K/Gas vesicle protein
MSREALDRILHRGVSVQGNVTIGLADVDLLFLDLRLLLGSVDTIWPEGRPPVPAVQPGTPPGPPPPVSEMSPGAPHEAAARDVAYARADTGSLVVPRGRLGEPASTPAQGLVRLVLTLVKLLHEVLERQAVRRMETGRLTEAQIENVGAALFAQAEEILRLQRQFGFADKDLSLDLGVPDGAL